MLAASSYVTAFPADSALSERVIFPAGPHETHGMEDARFVRFTDDDGGVTYYATYTAFDGFEIMPQLIQTDDFASFRIATLSGSGRAEQGDGAVPAADRRQVRDAVAPRSREPPPRDVDATSGTGRTSRSCIGRAIRGSCCRSATAARPLETDEGWLVITHGVGPMRRYVLGALLLDLDDPRRVVGQLREPLLGPEATEREGYVPNVVYSCGAMLNGKDLVLPYGLSDAAIGVARVSARPACGAAQVTLKFHDTRTLTMSELARRRRIRWTLVFVVGMVLALGVGLVLPT